MFMTDCASTMLLDRLLSERGLQPERHLNLGTHLPIRSAILITSHAPPSTSQPSTITVIVTLTSTSHIGTPYDIGGLEVESVSHYITTYLYAFASYTANVLAFPNHHNRFLLVGEHG
ncbi:hypothetical protein NQ318_000310 [Aromia moschata]|uniref:Uncharacterized protein n=1 Tax=Aromia moschata TaxID=1265417 RepID=A0AAV8YU34_9CUCU|nr:hypothetical protein NQ318_000310 [Aromia moschata]